MATVVSTGLREKGLKNEFFQRLGEMRPNYPNWSTRVPSTTKSEHYGWLGALPQVREWGTGRLVQGIRSESYSVENAKYELTIEVDRSELEDDQTGQIRMRINEMASMAASHKDYLIGELLVNGESAGYHSYDGLPFFSTLHESGDSGVQDNKLTSPGASPDSPTVDEFKAALKAAAAAMMAFKNDKGQPMMLKPEKLAIVVPPTMYFTAVEAVGVPAVTGNRNVLQDFASVTSFPWLTDASKWYLFGLGGSVKPFIFQDRVPVEFQALEHDSDSAFLHDYFLYGVRARYRMAYGYWQFAVRIDFT